MKVIFARIGFMKYYQGPQIGDETPIAGGGYNREELGHEVFNFKPVGRNMYGYFHPHMKPPYNINLKRIDPTSKDDYVENVLVIFFAKDPNGGGQVIVGWYKDARVYRSFQKPSNQPERNNFKFYITTTIDNATLLPINKRYYKIGHRLKTKEGNPGETNAFYTHDTKFERKASGPKNDWIEEAIDYVTNYTGPKIILIKDEDKSVEESNAIALEVSQGFQSDSEIRRSIEKYAMHKCKEFYENNGYLLTDTSLNQPYDFQAIKNKEELFIEVKGTQGSGEKIILTKNEVEMSKSHGAKMILFVVSEIILKNKVPISNSGKTTIIQPWEINEKKLTPICFNYELEKKQSK